MVQLPPFLRRCYRFPRSEEYREDDWYDRSRRRHRRFGRAFELSVSIEALLETRDAAQLLFGFLKTNCIRHEEEDVEEDDYEEDGDFFLRRDRKKILWISDDIFMVIGNFRRSDYLDGGRGSKSYMITLFPDFAFDRKDRVWIMQKPSMPVEQHAPVVELDTSSAPPLLLVNVMDVVLRLLAKYNVANISIVSNRRGHNDVHFPASLDALNAFVSEAQSERTIRMQNAGLSLEQWRVVTANSNKCVAIEIDYQYGGRSERFSPMETAIFNRFPAKIKISHLDKAIALKRQMFFTALESTTLVEELIFYFGFEDNKRILLCMDAISRNRHCQRLGIKFNNAMHQFGKTLEEWKLFCGAIASHPSLQEVQFYYGNRRVDRRFPSEEKDDLLIQMICQNTVLSKFEIDHQLLSNRDRFEKAVLPVLTWNRFRRVVQAIKQEPEPIHRQQLFTAVLLSNQVQQCTANSYLLLKENIDLFKPVPFTVEGKLLRASYRTDHHSAILETPMRDNGIAICTSGTKNESTQLGRKRKQSCLPAEVGQE